MWCEQGNVLCVQCLVVTARIRSWAERGGHTETLAWVWAKSTASAKQLLHTCLHTSTVVTGLCDLPAQQPRCAATAGAGYLQQLSHCIRRCTSQVLTLPQQVGVGAWVGARGSALSACYPPVLASCADEQFHRFRCCVSRLHTSAPPCHSWPPRSGTSSCSAVYQQQ